MSKIIFEINFFENKQVLRNFKFYQTFKPRPLKNQILFFQNHLKSVKK
jgi:hypothetical protein